VLEVGLTVNHGFCSFCFGGFRFFVSLNAVNRVYGQNRLGRLL